MSIDPAIFLVNALHLASYCVLYYDHLLTLPLEILYFWGTPLSTGNVLFFANRYFTFLSNLILVAIRDPSVNSSQACRPYLLAHQLSTTVAQAVVVAILCLRTYALYGRSKRILAVLVAAAVAGVAASAWSLMNQEGTPVNNFGAGCQSSSITPATATHIAIPWAVLMCIDVLIFALTAARTWNAGEADDLALVVRRDGAAYFAAMALVNLANILSFFVFPTQAKGGLSTLASAVSVTMASRLCLNIHGPRAPDIFTSVPGASALAGSWDAPPGKGESWWSRSASTTSVDSDIDSESAHTTMLRARASDTELGAGGEWVKMSERHDWRDTRELEDWLAWERVYGRSKESLPRR